jgi:hypothetical protein
VSDRVPFRRPGSATLAFFASHVLVLGALPGDGAILLRCVDAGARRGDRIGPPRLSVAPHDTPGGYVAKPVAGFPRAR